MQTYETFVNLYRYLFKGRRSYENTTILYIFTYFFSSRIYVKFEGITTRPYGTKSSLQTG